MSTGAGAGAHATADDGAAPAGVIAEDAAVAGASVESERAQPLAPDVKVLVLAANMEASEQVMAALESWQANFSVLFDMETTTQTLAQPTSRPQVVVLDAQSAPTDVGRLAGALRGLPGGLTPQVVWIGEPSSGSPLDGSARSVPLPVRGEALWAALAEAAAAALATDEVASSASVSESTSATELMSGASPAETFDRAAELVVAPASEVRG
jgi:hypothetical protein